MMSFLCQYFSPESSIRIEIDVIQSNRMICKSMQPNGFPKGSKLHSELIRLEYAWYSRAFDAVAECELPLIWRRNV